MKQDSKKLYESIMTSVAKEVKKALNEGEVVQPKSLEQICQELVAKYNKKEITGDNLALALKNALNGGDVKIVSKATKSVTVEYQGKRFKINVIKNMFTYQTKENGPIITGFSINGEQMKCLTDAGYTFVDKEGKLHNSEIDWDNIAVVKEQNIKGIPWASIKPIQSIQVFIKAWQNNLYK